MNRHRASLVGDLKTVASQIDIADLRDVKAARITDAELVATATPDDFLGPASVAIRDGTISSLPPRARALRVMPAPITASITHTRRRGHPCMELGGEPLMWKRHLPADGPVRRRSSHRGPQLSRCLSRLRCCCPHVPIAQRALR